MNPKSKIKVLYNESAIEMNKVFAKMVENPFSEEYKFLQKVRQDYPDYKVSVRKIKSNPQKESYRGLTYAYMENYIRSHEAATEVDEVMAEFNEMRLIAQCHSQAHRYPVIKKWFLQRYPKIENFGLTSEVEEVQPDHLKMVSNF